MTDSSDNITGNYGTKGPIIPCILDEGAPTVVAIGTVLNMQNVTTKTLTWASPLARGNMVAISNDTACTWAATGGSPVMEQAVNGETYVIGKIVSTPDELFRAEDREKMAKVIDTLQKPVIHYKVMAAGRNDPKKAFAFTAEHMKPGDAVCFGVYTKDNPNIFKGVFSRECRNALSNFPIFGRLIMILS